MAYMSRVCRSVRSVRDGLNLKCLFDLLSIRTGWRLPKHVRWEEIGTQGETEISGLGLIAACGFMKMFEVWFGC